MNKLEDAGVLDDMDEMAKAALKESLAIMKNGLTATKEKLVAARLVLDFTKAKPAQKQDITVRSAEEWLDEVVKDNGEAQADDSTESGTQEAA